MRESLVCILLAVVVVMGEHPNIMLIFPDQLRYDWIHTTYHNYGVPLRTPNINYLAENGTRFTRAVVASPVCAPSRACLASGKEYDHAGVPSNFHNDYPTNETTFYTLLKDNGYHVMVSGKDDLTKATGGPGPDGWKHGKALGFSDQQRCCGKMDVVGACAMHDGRKRTPHDPYGIFLGNHTANSTTLWHLHVEDFVDHDFSYNPLPAYGYQDNYICNKTMDMLRRKPANVPWFVQINIAGPHPPFDITKAMQKTVINRAFPGPHAYRNTTKVVDNRKWYAGEIERIDYWVGVFVEFVRSLGELDDTVICFASDHGEMLGDYGLWGKSKPWQGSISVPLICRGPGIKVNQTITAPTSTMDMAGTFLDYAGAQPAVGMTTKSLRNVLEGKVREPDRKHVLSGLANFRTVTVKNDDEHIFKYVCCMGKCPGSWFGKKNYEPDSDENTRTGLSKIMLSDTDVEEDVTATENEHHLFNIAIDRWDQTDVEKRHPAVAKHLRTLLPPPYNTACPLL